MFERPAAPSQPGDHVSEDERLRGELEIMRGTEAHHRVEIDRLEAEIAGLTERLANVPPGPDGTNDAYVTKHQIVTKEHHRDMATDEIEKLRPQIEEAKAALAAIGPVRETRPAPSLEAR